MESSGTCEFCRQIGLYQCIHCEASLCGKHIKKHKEQPPDTPHKVVPKRQSQPPDRLLEETTPAAAQRDGTLSGPVSISAEDYMDVSSSREREQAIPKKRKNSQSSESPNKRTIYTLSNFQNPTLPRYEERCLEVPEESISRPWAEAFSRRIFDSYDDIAQNFRLHKLILNSEGAEQLMKELSEGAEHVQVIGVYGCIPNCLQCIGDILHLERAPEANPEDQGEGIIAYCRRDLGIVCFWFKVDDDAIYERKPYSNSLREEFMCV